MEIDDTEIIVEELIEKAYKTNDQFIIDEAEKLREQDDTGIIEDFEEDYLNNKERLISNKKSTILEIKYQLIKDYNINRTKVFEKYYLNKGQLDKDSLNHTGYFFIIRMRCNYCYNNIFINDIKKNIICTHCNKNNTISEEYFRKIFNNNNLAYLTKLIEYKDNYNYPYTQSVGYPRCTECNDSLSDEEYWTLEEIEEAKKTGILHCKKCNKEYNVRNADEFAKSVFSSPIIAIITEKQEENKISNTNATTIKCCNCGANLKISGNQKTSICEYCNTENILPDTSVKPVAPLKQAIWVLLRKKHDIIFTEDNIDELYLLLKQELDNLKNKEEDKKEEDKKEEKIIQEEKEEEKETNNSTTKVILIGGVIVAAIYVLYRIFF